VLVGAGEGNPQLITRWILSVLNCSSPSGHFTLRSELKYTHVVVLSGRGRACIMMMMMIDRWVLAAGKH